MYIYIRQYVISSLQALTKMAKIGTWRMITNLQYDRSTIVSNGWLYNVSSFAVRISFGPDESFWFVEFDEIFGGYRWYLPLNHFIEKYKALLLPSSS